MKQDLRIKTVLKDIMKSKGITLANIAKETGVPKTTISEWLNNRHPNVVQAAAVANYLGVSLHTLLFGEEDKQEPISKLLKEDLFSGTFEITVKRVRMK